MSFLNQAPSRRNILLGGIGLAALPWPDAPRMSSACRRVGLPPDSPSGSPSTSPSSSDSASASASSSASGSESSPRMNASRIVTSTSVP